MNRPHVRSRARYEARQAVIGCVGKFPQIAAFLATVATFSLPLPQPLSSKPEVNKGKMGECLCYTAVGF